MKSHSRLKPRQREVADHVTIRVPFNAITRAALHNLAADLFENGGNEDIAIAIKLALEPEQLEKEHRPKPLTMGEVAAWMKETGASLHISLRDGKFLLVGHVGSGPNAHASADLTHADLEIGLKMLMLEF